MRLRMAPTRDSISPAGTRSEAPRRDSVSSCSRVLSAAARPVTASMRLSPAPIDVSAVMTMAPMEPEEWTCVPPQSSRLKQSDSSCG